MRSGIRFAILLSLSLEIVLFAVFNLLGSVVGAHHLALFVVMTTQLPGLAIGNRLSEVVGARPWLAFTLVALVTIVTQTALFALLLWSAKKILLGLSGQAPSVRTGKQS